MVKPCLLTFYTIMILFKSDKYSNFKKGFDIMKIPFEDIMNYHCPRWDELPEIELYIDQVIYILENNLAIFNKDNDSPLITPSMINNYVKQHVLKPPVKKKYNRSHLSYLFVICIFKRLMSLSEIRGSITMTRRLFSVEDGYNIFCEQLEGALKNAFDPSNNLPVLVDENDVQEVAALKAIVNSFANIILADRIIAIREE